MKKLLSVFLSALLLCASVFAVPVLTETTFSVLPSASAAAGDDVAGEEEGDNLDQVNTQNNAAGYIRDGFRNRQTDIRFQYTGANIEDCEYAKIEEMIFAYDKSNAQVGDYLRFNIQGFDFDIDDDIVTVESIEYRTSPEQETALSDTINDTVLPALAESNVTDDSSDVTKAIAIFDWLRNNVNYDGNDHPALSSYTAFGALINRIAVCEGISLAFYRLTLALGLNCRILVGEINDGEESYFHAWNAVRFGESWYHVDVTGAIQSENSEEPIDPYTFFMIPIGIEDESWECPYHIIYQEDATENGTAFYTANDIGDDYIFNGVITGECGDDATWSFLAGAFVITGSGSLYDYSDMEVPWREYAALITSIYIEDAITNINVNCFSGADPSKCIIHCAENSAANGSASAAGFTCHIINKAEEEISPTCTEPGKEAKWICGVDGCDFVFGGWVKPVSDNAHRDADNDGYCDNCDILMAAEAHGSCGDAIHWYLNEGVLVLVGTGDMSDFSRTNRPWYNLRNSINSVIIKPGITSIGSYAFDSLIKVSTVSISDTVNNMGDFAFRGCKSLRTIPLLEGLYSIGDNAFAGCTLLATISLPKGLYSIGDEAFEDCINLRNVILPEGLYSIGRAAFRDCESLEDLTLPNGLYSIGRRAFEGTIIKTITIPKTVKVMGALLVGGPLTGSVIESIIFEEGMTDIPNYACLNAKTLKNVFIPSTAISIGTWSFISCKNLSFVWIPSEDTTIGKGAFSSASSFLVIHCPENSHAAEFAQDNNIAFHTELSYDPLQMDLCSGSESVRISMRCEECGCAVAGNRLIDSNGHTIVVEQKSATCTEPGYYRSYCGVCGITLEDKSVIPAKGHTPEPKSAEPPTCTKDGHTEGVICSVCRQTLSGYTPIPATGHTDSDGNGYCDNCEAEMQKHQKKTIYQRIAEFFEAVLGIADILKALFSGLISNWKR